jgi:hypothetical protein
LADPPATDCAKPPGTAGLGKLFADAKKIGAKKRRISGTQKG